MRRFLLAAASLAILIPGSALGVTCSNTDPNATQHDTDAGTFYVTNDDCSLANGCTFSLWIYYESNNIPGLQRGDEVMGGGPGWCTPDTDVF
jgi:hypothetical protein